MAIVQELFFLLFGAGLMWLVILALRRLVGQAELLPLN